MRGTAYVFGDEVNTDVITPSDYFGEHIEVMAEHIFEPKRPNFAEKIDKDDIIVAGEHFGSGSSRESAPGAIQEAGISAVVAESFSRIFYRNAVAIGLPAITCPEVTAHVSEGDKLDVDTDSGIVHNLATNKKLDAQSLPEEIQSIFNEGGLLNHYKNHPEGLRL